MTPTRTLRPEAQIAAHVRRSIAQARKTSALGLPADATVSVRSENGSMYAAVNINVTADPGWALRYGQHSPAARQVADQIAAMFRAHRTTVDAGYVWGDVLINGTSAGSIPSASWRPNDD